MIKENNILTNSLGFISAALCNRLSSIERETVAVEEIKVEYEELLREHKASESQTFSSDEITQALMATQNPGQGLSDRNAEVLVGLLTFEDIHLKHTAVLGIANSAAFTNNQVIWLINLHVVSIDSVWKLKISL